MVIFFPNLSSIISEKKKKRGYPQSSFWILIAPAKIRMVLGGQIPSETQMSRDAQNLCAVTNVGTVLNKGWTVHLGRIESRRGPTRRFSMY